jgi:uncharacterized membrane protein
MARVVDTGRVDEGLTKDSRFRSVAKAVTYRLTGSVLTAAVVYAVTGEMAIATGAGAIDALAKTVLYYVHERVWSRIP